ncbi:MAG: hypothetical protein Q8916_15040 [Bacteroidota bacterium]|nr:hypothetical protein [Bacteroidota bacterium]MDP4231713.1 hypothetical protein [Bacteroidota bacterium]MDP4236831.1 hypothetical protein [Bacteroidota bacterium]
MSTTPHWDPATSQIVLDLTDMTAGPRNATVTINFGQASNKVRQVTINGIPPPGIAPYLHIWKTCPVNGPNQTVCSQGQDNLLDKDLYSIKPDFLDDMCANQGLPHLNFPAPTTNLQAPPVPNPLHVETTSFAFQVPTTNISVGITVLVEDDTGGGGGNTSKILKAHGPKA